MSAVRLGDADEVVRTQAVNQIEAHPLLLQDDLVNYCKEHNIHITAYSPLGNNSTSLPPTPIRSLALSDLEAVWTVAGHKKLTEYPEVLELAQKYNATPAQVLIAWGVKRGYSVIPKSVTPGTPVALPPAAIYTLAGKF